MAALVLGHMNPDTDSIISAIAAADLYSKRGFEVTPAAQGAPTPETEFVLKKFGLTAPQVVEDVAGKDLYLVDYSDLAQAPKGMDSATVLGIVDHHKLGDVTTSSPLEAWIWPVGCTGTVLKNMYDFYGVELPKAIAGGLLCAILSDTVMFKSPTCTQRDIDVANRMARIANISLQALGQVIFSASGGGAKSAEEIFRTDYKEFHIAGHNLAVSQVTCMDAERLTERTEEFLDCMRGIRHDYGLDTVLLMITDVLKEGSYLLYVGDEDTIRQAFNIPGEKNPVFLPEVMSRKKQIIPVLSALWG